MEAACPLLSPSGPILFHTHSSSSTMSTNSSLLDIPLSIYTLEDGSAKSSTTSFVTTGRREAPSDRPIPYDDINRGDIPLSQHSKSPTMLLRMRARSKSVAQPSSNRSESKAVLSARPVSSSLSVCASSDQLSSQYLNVQAPSYEESIAGNPQRRRRSSADSFDYGANEREYIPLSLRNPGESRPEEGNEILPEYSCSVFRSSVLNRKVECIYPGLAAKKREWVKVYMCLLGTVLRVYLIQRDGTLPPGFSLNSPFREYTLQYAEAGIASDYVKRKYVLRVRAEGEQFLMQCSSDEERDAWVESIQAGSSIALALEERNMPKHITLPRRRRGRHYTAISRSRPVVQRTAPRGTPTLHLVQSAPNFPTADESGVPYRTACCTTVGSERSTSTSCVGEASQDSYLDDATALALCLNAGRSHPSPRERILISMLTARQHRQNEWVVINGMRRKIDPKTGVLEEPLPDGVDPVEDECKAHLLKSKRSLSSRFFKMF